MVNDLMFFLLATALLLIMGFLAACLWCLLLILRQYLDYVKKTSKEDTRHTENVIMMPTCPIESPLNEQETKTIDTPSEKLGEKADYKSEQSNEGHSEEICEDISTKILKIMRFASKNNYIHLRVVNKSFISCLEEYELIEDSDGKLIILQDQLGECIVVPESENISEKEYEYCGVKGCYETNMAIKSGCYYQITQILELCMVQKHENKYTIQSKGKLMLEQK